MGHYWQRVDVQRRTTTMSETGAEQLAWTDRLLNVEARVSPLTHTEQLESWATPEEQAYEVQLRGSQGAVEVSDRVLLDGVAYDVRQVMTPPPFGTPTTVLLAVLVTP